MTHRTKPRAAPPFPSGPRPRLRTVLLLAAALTLVAAPLADDARAAKPKVLLKTATLAPEGSTWMTSHPVFHSFSIPI